MLDSSYIKLNKSFTYFKIFSPLHSCANCAPNKGLWPRGLKSCPGYTVILSKKNGIFTKQFSQQTGTYFPISLPDWVVCCFCFFLILIFFSNFLQIYHICQQRACPGGLSHWGFIPFPSHMASIFSLGEEAI